MKKCGNCGNTFPNKQFIDGKEYTFYNRVYCLTCSPLHSHKMHKSKGMLFKIKGRSIIRNCKICMNTFKTKNAYTICHACKSTITRNERKKYIIELFGNKCVICGYNKINKNLVFHHINKEENYLIYHIIGKNLFII